MKRIELTNGKHTVIDDEDFDIVNLFHWWHTTPVGGKIYAVTAFWMYGKRVQISLHRLIINAKKGQHVDHKDDNGLNNQKSNLRLCNHRENQWNTKGHKNATSKYKGVYKAKKEGRWVAQIRINGKKKYLGYFYSEDAAGQAYNFVAKEIHGKFANLNNI